MGLKRGQPGEMGSERMSTGEVGVGEGVAGVDRAGEGVGQQRWGQKNYLINYIYYINFLVLLLKFFNYLIN